MSVIIVGGGRTGTGLARLLSNQGKQVALVDVDPANMESLSSGRIESGGVTIVEGDGTDPRVLESTGIREAEIFIAVTGSDTVNGLAAQRALYEYEVQTTILSARDDGLKRLYQSLGLSTVNPTQLTVDSIVSGVSNRGEG